MKTQFQWRLMREARYAVTKTTFDSRRHPIAGCAVLLVALLAAGCSQDDGRMTMQNPTMTQAYAQGRGDTQGPGFAPGRGDTQGPGFAPGRGDAQGPGFAPGRGDAQGPGFAPGRGDAQGPGFAPGRGDAQGPGFAPGRGDAQGPGFAPGRGDAQGSGFAPGRGDAMNPGNPGRIAGERSGGERSGGSLDELMAWERQDMGVGPTRELHSGGMHGPTPNQIPGGQVITTKGLLPLLQQGIPVYVFDVLGTSQTLPNAIPASRAAAPGSFDDETQQQLAQMLQQVTRGNSDAPLVFYCQGPQCWMSYNAALRAIALGYRNVLWYRGGMEAWNHAGQQFVPARSQG